MNELSTILIYLLGWVLGILGLICLGAGVVALVCCVARAMDRWWE